MGSAPATVDQAPLPAAEPLPIRDELTGAGKDEYGQQYDQHRLEQYKLYVEMADRISGRRMTANSFFLTVNTALVAFLGLSISGVPNLTMTPRHVIVAIAGSTISFFWFRLIRSYSDLNAAKFKVIHEVEARMPLRLYDHEWTMLGRGADPALYLPVTAIEKAVPLVFIALYVGLGVWAALAR